MAFKNDVADDMALVWPRVVMRRISDGRTDGWIDGRTMAAAASVTWMHYSVLFEVT
jgi:hypothetical protein